MTMVCDVCGHTGIRWMGPLVNLTHTECPHCGGTNCQRDESDAFNRCMECGEDAPDCRCAPPGYEDMTHG